MGNDKKYSIEDLYKRFEEYTKNVYDHGIKTNQELGPSKATMEFMQKVDKKLEKLDTIYSYMFGIDEKDSGLRGKIDNIERHVTKTNGRVTKLETWRTTAVVVTLAIAGTVSTLSWYFINKFDRMNDQVVAHIASDTRTFNEIKK